MSEQYQRNQGLPARLGCWASVPFANLACHGNNGKSDEAETHLLSCHLPGLAERHHGNWGRGREMCGTQVTFPECCQGESESLWRNDKLWQAGLMNYLLIWCGPERLSAQYGPSTKPEQHVYMPSKQLADVTNTHTPQLVADECRNYTESVKFIYSRHQIKKFTKTLCLTRIQFCWKFLSKPISWCILCIIEIKNHDVFLLPIPQADVLWKPQGCCLTELMITSAPKLHSNPKIRARSPVN